eukprot:5628777-Pyramimonas_sp.AAC.2
MMMGRRERREEPRGSARRAPTLAQEGPERALRRVNFNASDIDTSQGPFSTLSGKRDGPQAPSKGSAFENPRENHVRKSSGEPRSKTFGRTTFENLQENRVRNPSGEPRSKTFGRTTFENPRENHVRGPSGVPRGF